MANHEIIRTAEGREVRIPRDLSDFLVAMTDPLNAFFKWVRDERLGEPDGLEWLISFSITKEGGGIINPFQGVSGRKEKAAQIANEILDMICAEREKLSDRILTTPEARFEIWTKWREARLKY